MRPRLLLDLGNTRLKWALATPIPADSTSGPLRWRLGESKALAHAGPDFLPAVERALRELPEVDSMHWVAVAADATVEAVRLCVEDSVRSRRPGLQRAATSASAVLRDGRRLICGYPQPGHLGVDRWLGLRGALAELAPPVLVVSAGTALTLDAVDADCRHLGGLILAGMAEIQSGLLARAPHLVQGSRCPDASEFWARDTAPAVGMAPWQAAAGLVERAARRLQRELGCAPAVVLAGGDAEALLPLLDLPARVEQQLVLKGLLQAALDS